MKTNKYFLILTLAVAGTWTISCKQDDSDLIRPKAFATEFQDIRSESIFSKGDKVDGLLFGRPAVDWTAEWWKFVMSFDCATNPLLTDSPIVPDGQQDGPVYFLVGGRPGSVIRELRVPFGQTLLAPVVNVLNDYPCPGMIDTDVPSEKIEALLKDGARQYIDRAQNMKVSLDGKTISIGKANRMMTDLFYFTGNKDLVNCYDPCVTGFDQAAVSDGYWILLQNLSRGKHILHIHAELVGYDLVYDVAFTILVY